MTPAKLYLLRATFGAVMLIVGWWLSFRPDKVNQYFGNPVFSRTPLMASLNRTHSIIFGILLMLAGVILGAQNVLNLVHLS
jgi:hypothetical protein